MPRYFMLKNDGIKPELYRVAYSGAHDATVACSRAARSMPVVNASVWQKLVDAGKVDATGTRSSPTYFI